MVARKDLKQLGPYLYEIPQEFRSDMRAPARIYADEEIVRAALVDESITQLINTATLPGIVRYALAMPDIHQGYGFSIGGVVATRESDGVVSPGGVGYDINCLAADAEMLHAYGYHRPISDMAQTWQEAALACFQLEASQLESAPVMRWFAQVPASACLPPDDRQRSNSNRHSRPSFLDRGWHGVARTTLHQG